MEYLGLYILVLYDAVPIWMRVVFVVVCLRCRNSPVSQCLLGAWRTPLVSE